MIDKRCLAILASVGLVGCSTQLFHSNSSGRDVSQSPAFAPVKPSPTASYVKLSQARYLIMKPFPTIFFVNEQTNSNRVIREFAVVLSPQDQFKLTAVASTYCERGLKLHGGTEEEQLDEVVSKYDQRGLILAIKSAGEDIKPCFIAEPAHCDFFRDIKAIRLSTDVVKADEHLAELEEDMECVKP